MKIKKWAAATVLVAIASNAEALTEDPSCQTISFAEIGWTDTTVITSLTRFLLDRLGYQTKVDRLSVPDTFKALGSAKLDVLMGNWMPSQQAELEKYRKSIDVIRANLEDARFTLAVPRYIYESGVKSVKDLAARKEEFGGIIHGVKNSAGSEKIQLMIKDNAYALGGFELIDKSEAVTMAIVQGKIAIKKAVVFLAWEPHPMNTQIDFEYLSGADDYFGPNFGASTVYTVAATSLRKRCPNVALLLAQLNFNVAMENELMDRVLNQNTNPRRSARDWLKQNPKVVEGWLKGVTTRGGAPGLPVVRESLLE